MYKDVDGISGATILGDGEVALIVDVAALVRLSGRARDAPNWATSTPGCTEVVAPRR